MKDALEDESGKAKVATKRGGCGERFEVEGDRQMGDERWEMEMEMEMEKEMEKEREKERGI